MIRRIVRSWVHKTHHWRDIGQSEMAELYVSISLRSLALSMVSIFLPIYFYELGYSLPLIIGYFLAFSVSRLVFNVMTAYIVGRIGPKHTIALATISEIGFMLMVVTLDTLMWPLLLLGVVHSLTNSLFFTAYHVDFSKVKQTRDAGKELGHMILIQKIFGMIGPFVGGLLATVFDIRVSVAVSLGLMIISLVPLFMSKEPVRLHQHIIFKGITPKIRSRSRNVLALCGLNTSSIISSTVWVLFISLTVFTDNTYAYVGLLATISTFVSVFLARYIGRQTDEGKGRRFIAIGSWGTFVLNLSKLFIGSPVAVSAVGVAETQTVLSKHIPIGKGFYAEADEFPGQRIAYVTVIENLLQLLRIPFWVILIALLMYFENNQYDVLRYASVSAGFFGLLSLLEKYPSLRKDRVK